MTESARSRGHDVYRYKELGALYRRERKKKLGKERYGLISKTNVRKVRGIITIDNNSKI